MNPKSSPVLLCLLFVCWIALGTANEDGEVTELRMPAIQPNKADTYACHSLRLDPEQEHYLVEFVPHGSMKTAHHMLLFGCETPGSEEEIWDCGEMHKDEGSQYEQGPVCSSGAQIIYAWAKDAPQFMLPKDVGFKVGGQSSIQYLVLQVHYMHPLTHPDYSGITLHSTSYPLSKTAATLLMSTDGAIAAHSKEHFDTACLIDEDVVLHPIAFRTHTHKCGKVVSGWKVRHGDTDKWELVGKKNPQLPEMFYPVTDPKMTLQKGDIVAARCFMENNEDHDIRVGPTGEDEMCNFYLMYWVEGDNALSDNYCNSPGPPFYNWETEGGLSNVPTKETESE